MDAIQASARFPKIEATHLVEFKQLAADALDSARGESGTLQYDWFFSDDDTQCVVRETYRDSEAVLAHLGNVGPLLGRMIEARWWYRTRGVRLAVSDAARRDR